MKTCDARVFSEVENRDRYSQLRRARMRRLSPDQRVLSQGLRPYRLNRDRRRLMHPIHRERRILVVG